MRTGKSQAPLSNDIAPEVVASASHKSKRWKRLGCFSPLLFMAIVWLLPYLYTPPALTDEKLEVYSEFVALVRTGRGWNPATSSFSKSAIAKTEELAPRMRDVGCGLFTSSDSTVFFYPSPDLFTPLAAGVLYSLDGTDPNLIEDKWESRFQPYEKIAGNWYASRKIILGRGGDEIPRSLFDSTLKPPRKLRQ